MVAMVTVIVTPPPIHHRWQRIVSAYHQVSNTERGGEGEEGMKEREGKEGVRRMQRKGKRERERRAIGGANEGEREREGGDISASVSNLHFHIFVSELFHWGGPMCMHKYKH